MKVVQTMVGAAISLVEDLYTGDPDGDGWAGADAMYASVGRILTSMFVDSPNAAASLYCEGGAIAEAHKLNLAVVATVCVSRDGPDAPFVILTPLRDLSRAVGSLGRRRAGGGPVSGRRHTLVKLLREVQPHYWSDVNGSLLLPAIPTAYDDSMRLGHRSAIDGARHRRPR